MKVRNIDNMQPDSNWNLDLWLPARTRKRNRRQRLQELAEKKKSELDMDIKRHNKIREHGIGAVSDFDRDMWGDKQALQMALYFTANHCFCNASIIASAQRELEEMDKPVQKSLFAMAQEGGES